MPTASSTGAPLRVLIVEEALGQQPGHWRHYIGDIAAGLRASGDQVDVLCHRGAPAALLQEVGGTPWMQRSLWAGHQGKLADFKHILGYIRDVSRYFREHPGYDVVLCLTMRWQHAVAWNSLARRWGNEHFKKAVLLFVIGPGRYVGAGQPSMFASSIRNRLWRGAMRLLRSQQAAGRIVFAAETGRMREELQRFSGLPIRQFCHPVVVSEVTRRTDQAVISARGQRTLTLCAPGFARYEKGSDLLQEALLLLARQTPAPDIRLIMQWLKPFQLPDGTKLALRPELAALPRVRVIDREINPAEYSALLADSDLLVLPYRPESYHARVSRVAIEAVTAGLPLIYTPGTWMEEVCQQHGAGVPIRSLTAAGVAQAICAAVACYAELAATAAQRAAAARAYFSVAHFRRSFSAADKS